MELATFGAGCFWGVELRFRAIEGVLDAAVGYTGGTTDNPDYHAVCTGTTYHAEVVRLSYDPALVDYDTLLNAFWQMHNPTTPDRQGPDVGTQYRSVIFYHTEAQRMLAEHSKTQLENAGVFDQAIVTQIEPAVTFYRAEEYHQQYLAKRGQGACGI